MSKQRNPFEHHHDHGHDDHAHGSGHDHAHAPGGGVGHDHGLPEAEVDPAQQSLADALRVSFTILKFVMIVLLVVYAFSGFFNVPQQTVAMRLRFGRIVNEGSPDAIIQPGGPHFAFPYPIEEVVKLPVSPRSIELNREFWPGSTEPGALNPERDGSLITGDYNLVHAQFSVGYNVSDPILFMKHVGNMEVAEEIVRAAAEQAAIRVVGTQPTEKLVLTPTYGDGVRLAAQTILGEMETGLSITNVAIGRTDVPVAIQEMYKNVAIVHQTRQQPIEQAVTDRARILGQAAGEGHDALWEMIQRYQTAVVAGDGEGAARHEAELDRAFRELNTGPENGNKALSGQVSQLIGDATNFKRSITARTQGEVGTFNSFYERYKENPSLRRIVVSRLAQDAKQDIMTGDVDTMWLPTGQRILEISPDPEVKKRRDEARIKAEAAAAGGPRPPGR